MMKKISILISMGLLVFLHGLAEPLSFRDIEVSAGQAAVWYLYHNGFAVKTQSALIIFDYWEPMDPPENPSLFNGFIDPEEIREEKVYVFTSHGHGDHYDEKILAWKDAIPDITYIFGWPNENIPDVITFDKQRHSKSIGLLSVKNIYHEFDGIPESAFVIEVDGLTIYYAGDHGNGPRALNPVYKDNIDYISGQAPRFDLVFLSVFGSPGYVGELYAVKKFAPKVMVPMHFGDREARAQDFVDSASSLFKKTRFWYPLKKGDGFFYTGDQISSLKERRK
jgi:L-ascorbate metabolism protein UlaG (beta-lactamase superfamily)